MKVGNKYIVVENFAGMSKSVAMESDSAVGDVWDEIQSQLKLAGLDTEPKPKRKKSEKQEEEEGE